MVDNVVTNSPVCIKIWSRGHNGKYVCWGLDKSVFIIEITKEDIILFFWLIYGRLCIYDLNIVCCSTSSYLLYGYIKPVHVKYRRYIVIVIVIVNLRWLWTIRCWNPRNSSISTSELTTCNILNMIVQTDLLLHT